jgi:hypothetical protein
MRPWLTGCGQALTEEKEERGNGSGDNYLPGQEELQTMTRDQLNEVERRQEEYLLTIRKIKVLPPLSPTKNMKLDFYISIYLTLLFLLISFLLFVICYFPQISLIR